MSGEMQDAKAANSKLPSAAVPRRPTDTAEVGRLVDALEALEISEADDPTQQETHRLRRGVVDASLALERKQARLRSS